MSNKFSEEKSSSPSTDVVRKERRSEIQVSSPSPKCQSKDGTMKNGEEFKEWKTRKDMLIKVQNDLKYMKTPSSIFDWLTVGRCLKIIDDQESYFRIWHEWSRGFCREKDCRIVWDLTFHPVRKYIVDVEPDTKKTKITNRLAIINTEEIEAYAQQNIGDNFSWIQKGKDVYSHDDRNHAVSIIHTLTKKKRKIDSLKQLLSNGSAPFPPTLENSSESKNINLSQNILIEWKMKVGSPKPSFFILEMKQDDISGNFHEIYRDPVDIDSDFQYNFLVKNLTPNTSYTFRICAYNVFGCSSFTQRSFYTHTVKPSSPALVDASSQSLTISWDYDDSESAKLLSEKHITTTFGIEQYDFRNDTWKTCWKGKLSRVTINYLRYGTIYKFRVYAINRSGKTGPRSDSTNMLTLLPPPSPPRFVLQSEVGHEYTVNFSWDKFDIIKRNKRLPQNYHFVSWVCPHKMDTNSLALSQVFSSLVPDGRLHSSQTTEILTTLGISVESDQIFSIYEYFKIDERKERYVTFQEFNAWLLDAKIHYSLFVESSFPSGSDSRVDSEQNERIRYYHGTKCGPIQINGLKANHTYLFSFKISSNYSSSVPCKNIRVHTPPSQPSKPILIELYPHQLLLTSVLNTDNLPSKIVLEIKHIKRGNNSIMGSWSIAFTGDVGSLIKISMLSPCSEYKLRCRYFNPLLEVKEPLYSTYSEEIQIMTPHSSSYRETESFSFKAHVDYFVAGDLIRWCEDYLCDARGNIIIDNLGETFNSGSFEKDINDTHHDLFLVQRKIIGRLIHLSNKRRTIRIEIIKCIETFNDPLNGRKQQVKLNILNGVIDREIDSMKKLDCYRTHWIDESRRSQVVEIWQSFSKKM